MTCGERGGTRADEELETRREHTGGKEGRRERTTGRERQGWVPAVAPVLAEALPSASHLLFVSVLSAGTSERERRVTGRHREERERERER
jgi:hypothetical protein